MPKYLYKMEWMYIGEYKLQEENYMVGKFSTILWNYTKIVVIEV